MPVLLIARDAEAGEGAVGEPPGGFGDIGVGFLPGFVEGGAPIALDFERRLEEGAAFEDGFVAGDLRTPFAGVAEHVVEAPGVGFFLHGGHGFVVGVFLGPGHIENGFLVELHRVFCAGAAGVFPFGFGGEAIFLAGFFGEPDAIHFGGFVGDGDDREAGMAVAAVGGEVGFAGAGFGVDAGFLHFDFLVFG